MALNKLYYVYGLDTACFYTDEENEVDKRTIKARVVKAHIEQHLKKGVSKCGVVFSETKIKKYRKWHKEISKFIADNKVKLINIFNKNKNLVRTARQDKLYVDINGETVPTPKKRVSIFDSTLTRCFGLKEREFNIEIVIIKVFFFEVAESIIKNGFMMNGEKYVFFSSSAGQIRTKKMVCVKESLLNEYWNTLTCGLTVEHINSLGGMNINKYLAYLALCNSATDQWFNFDISKTIVVDDFENGVPCEVDHIDDITYEITRKTMNVPIPHMDGCGLMLPTVSDKNFMVRLPWVKGLLGVFDFVKFIKEYKCSPVVIDIYGVEHDILKEDIQIIFTKSQFKMWKYFDNWGQYKDNFVKYHCQAGTCNVEDDFPQATINYQMIQSLLDISDDELKNLCEESNSFIKDITSNPETMLVAFGALEDNSYKNAFQKCLIKYPELLGDAYTRQSLRDLKDSLEKELWSAKFKVNGCYTFILPDLFAFCEWLFLHKEYPDGILQGKNVHCKLFNFDEEVDCLRSPHLYMEHAIRNNVTTDKLEKWFTTKAIYTSCHDVISKILMFDVDGDKALVVQDKTLIEIAKRNMVGIVPLFYDMKKAKCELITGNNLYTGLTLAYTGGNIGIYSNDISKIKNSDALKNNDSKDEALKCIKWLCLENNQTIDYAKTLYKSKRPKEVDEIIKRYTQKKLPAFFKYAKDKDDEQVELINDSPVNRIFKLFPKKNLNFNFKNNNIGKFNYELLMSNPDTEINKEIISTYRKRVRKLKQNITDYDKDGNYNSLLTDIKNELLDLGYDEKYICDVLVKQLFGISKSINKRAFWSIYGDIVYENLCRNIDENYIQCEKCKTRFYVKKVGQIICDECLQREIDKTEKLKKKHKKLIICCDCGAEFEVDMKNNQANRCSSCYAEYRKEYKAKAEKKRRMKSKI